MFFATSHHIVGEQVCIRSERGFCGISYTACADMVGALYIAEYFAKLGCIETNKLKILSWEPKYTGAQPVWELHGERGRFGRRRRASCQSERQNTLRPHLTFSHARTFSRWETLARRTGWQSRAPPRAPRAAQSRRSARRQVLSHLDLAPWNLSNWPGTCVDRLCGEVFCSVTSSAAGSNSSSHCPVYSYIRPFTLRSVQTTPPSQIQGVPKKVTFRMIPEPRCRRSISSNRHPSQSDLDRPLSGKKIFGLVSY